MAEPKLQIEERVDQIEKRLDRQENAIGSMATWLVQAQTGFSQLDASNIEKILRGENEEENGQTLEEMGSDARKSSEEEPT